MYTPRALFSPHVPFRISVHTLPYKMSVQSSITCVNSHYRARVQSNGLYACIK